MRAFITIAFALLTACSPFAHAGPNCPPGEPTCPSAQAMCNSLLKIIGWNDLRESAGPTNADRVKGSGLIRIMGKQLAAASPESHTRYGIFFPPEPGVPHAKVDFGQQTDVAVTSAGKPEQVPVEVLDRLGGLLQDGRHDWENVRYFYSDFDPLQATEIASMWQRHARNATDLQEPVAGNFGGDKALGDVQAAIENGMHGGKPFWAYMGFDSTVEGLGGGDLVFPNPGPGYAASVPKGSKVRVDYILKFDPSNPTAPSGMVIVLRTPNEAP